MISLQIPLIGIIEVSEEYLRMIGMVVTARSAELDTELMDLLIHEKFEGRYRSINDVIRDKYGLPLTHPHVKMFSDEGVQDECVRHRRQDKVFSGAVIEEYPGN